MYEDRSADDASELWSDMIDLTWLHLDQLDHLPETVFLGALRRILRENLEQPNSYEQYQSSI
jgi:hypothetical protein